MNRGRKYKEQQAHQYSGTRQKKKRGRSPSSCKRGNRDALDLKGRGSRQWANILSITRPNAKGERIGDVLPILNAPREKGKHALGTRGMEEKRGSLRLRIRRREEVLTLTESTPSNSEGMEGDKDMEKVYCHFRGGKRGGRPRHWGGGNEEEGKFPQRKKKNAVLRARFLTKKKRSASISPQGRMKEQLNPIVPRGEGSGRGRSCVCEKKLPLGLSYKKEVKTREGSAKPDRCPAVGGGKKRTRWRKYSFRCGRNFQENQGPNTTQKGTITRCISKSGGRGRGSS